MSLRPIPIFRGTLYCFILLSIVKQIFVCRFSNFYIRLDCVCMSVGLFNRKIMKEVFHTNNCDISCDFCFSVMWEIMLLRWLMMRRLTNFEWRWRTWLTIHCLRFVAGWTTSNTTSALTILTRCSNGTIAEWITSVRSWKIKN